MQPSDRLSACARTIMPRLRALSRHARRSPHGRLRPSHARTDRATGGRFRTTSDVRGRLSIGLIVHRAGRWFGPRGSATRRWNTSAAHAAARAPDLGVEAAIPICLGALLDFGVRLDIGERHHRRPYGRGRSRGGVGRTQTCGQERGGLRDGARIRRRSRDRRLTEMGRMGDHAPGRRRGVRDAVVGARENSLRIDAATPASRLEEQLARHDGRQALCGLDGFRHGRACGSEGCAGSRAQACLRIGADTGGQARKADRGDEQDSDQSQDAPASAWNPVDPCLVPRWR